MLMIDVYFIYHYIRTSFADPGYLKLFFKQIENENSEDYDDEKKQINDSPGDFGDDPQIELNFCTDCSLYKVLDSHHCFVCKICIINMDHHCRNVHTLFQHLQLLI